jgi:Ca2+-binding RTX toxin-like protein
MTQIVYNNAKYMLFNKALGIASDDIRCLLLGNASVPAGAKNPDLITVADLLGVTDTYELVATNYARKLTSRTISKDDVLDRVTGSLSSNITWTALGGATNDIVRAAIFYVEGGSDALRYLISLHELTLAIPTNGADFALPSGIVLVGT